MRAGGAGRGKSGLMVTGAFDGRVLVDELGAWTQQSKMEAEGRKEADSAPILITASSALFQTLVCAQQRRALARMLAYPRALGTTWRRAWPEGKPCRVSKKSKRVDAAPGLGARQKGEPSRLAGAGQDPPESITTGPYVQAPPSARAGQPDGAVSKSPKMLGRAVQGAPRRPNATEERRIGRSAHQFFFFAGSTWLCQSATLAKPWDRQRPRSRSRLRFQPRKCQAAGMPSLGVPLFANSKKKVG